MIYRAHNKIVKHAVCRKLPADYVPVVMLNSQLKRVVKKTSDLYANKVFAAKHMIPVS